MTLDEFIIKIGLDPTQFNEGQKKALENFRKTRQEMSAGAKGLEDVVGNVQRRVVGMFFAFTGAKSIEEFASNIQKADISLGRFSMATGMSLTKLSALQNVAKQMGGTGQGIAGTLRNFLLAYENFQLKGDYSAQRILQPLNHDIHELQDPLKFLLSVGKQFKEMSAGQALAFQNYFGIDEDTFLILRQHGDTLAEQIKLQEKLAAATKEDADAALKLQNSWATMVQTIQAGGRKAITSASPFLESLFGMVGDLASGNLPDFNFLSGGLDLSNKKKTSGLYSKSAEDYRYLIGQGWTPAQAAGIVGNIQAESSGNSNASNVGHYGLAQWDANRQADFKKWSGGTDILDADRNAQLRFLTYELRFGKEQNAGRRLKLAADARSAAAAMLSAERPAKPGTPEYAKESLRRQTYATLIALSQTKPLTVPNAITMGGALPPSHSTNATHIGVINLHINTNAKDANGMASDIKRALLNTLGAKSNSGAR